jgi:ZIP family zinc transporter
MEAFLLLPPVLQAVVATTFTWLMTAIGSLPVVALREPSRRLLDSMLGFAAGVMLAAGFWSLLLPAIELSAGQRLPAWVPAVVGMTLGGLVLYGTDQLLPHLHLDFPMDAAEGMPTAWRRSTLFLLAVSLHNIPEGLAVGVAFGALAAGAPQTSLAGALVLALGIGLQNLPEGMAVALSLRRESFSVLRSVWYAQLSGFVEPVAGLVGALAVVWIRPLLPYAMSFAAGAMFYVIIEELIPESQLGRDTNLPTAAAMVGFMVMMILEVGT